ncbi:MAG: hypothetical protein ACPHRO_04920, partial [Nannocystaceae bacterium]
AAALSSMFVFIGLATKTAGLVMMALHAGLWLRHPAIVDDSTWVALVVLGWTMILPCDQWWSVDAWRARGRGERMSRTAYTSWAWIGPLILLGCCLMRTSSLGALGVRAPFLDGPSLGVALRDAVELRPLARALLQVDASRLATLSGVLHGLALLGAALFVMPRRVRATRIIGGVAFTASAVVSTALVATPPLWWTLLAVVLGLQQPPEGAQSQRSRTSSSRSLEQVLGLVARECVGIVASVALIVMFVATGMRTMARTDADPQRGWMTSDDDARRAAILRATARSSVSAVSLGPWSRLKIVTQEVELVGTDRIGDPYRWRGGAWRGRAVSSDAALEGVEPGEDDGRGSDLRSRYERTMLARLADQLYTYGAIEVERMVWGSPQAMKDCSKIKETSRCMEIVELRVRSRSASEELRLGPAEVVYTGRRASPGRVALVPRGGTRR